MHGQAELSGGQSLGLGLGYAPGLASDPATFSQNQGAAGVSLLPVGRIVPREADVDTRSARMPICQHVGGNAAGFSSIPVDEHPVRLIFLMPQSTFFVCNVWLYGSMAGYDALSCKCHHP